MDYHTYTFTDPHPAVDGATSAIIAGLAILFMGFIFLLSYVICAFLLARIFKKAGVPQWAAWVPIYNVWKMLELGGQQGFWSIFLLIPFANLVATIFMCIASYHIGKKLGKEDWFVLLAIFLPVVWLIWLAFDDSEWPAPKSAHKKPKSRKNPVPRRKSTSG